VLVLEYTKERLHDVLEPPRTGTLQAIDPISLNLPFSLLPTLSPMKRTMRVGLVVRITGRIAAFIAFRSPAVIKCGSLKTSKRSAWSWCWNRSAICHSREGEERGHKVGKGQYVQAQVRRYPSCPSIRGCTQPRGCTR